MIYFHAISIKVFADGEKQDSPGFTEDSLEQCPFTVSENYDFFSFIIKLAHTPSISIFLNYLKST